MILKAVAAVCFGVASGPHPTPQRVSLPVSTVAVPVAGTVSANHGVTHLWGTGPVLGQNAEQPQLTFWSDTLPETKPMRVTADLMQLPSREQSRLLTGADKSWRLTVRCSSVEVSAVNGANGVEQQAHGKDCKLY